jgi:hypothetical protein
MATTLLLSVAVAIVLEIAAVLALGGAPVGTWAAGGASGVWASGVGADSFNFSSGDYGSCGDGTGDSGGGCGGD